MRAQRVIMSCLVIGDRDSVANCLDQFADNEAGVEPVRRRSRESRNSPLASAPPESLPAIARAEFRRPGDAPPPFEGGHMAGWRLH